MDTRRSTGRSLGPHKKQYSFENQGALDITDFWGLSRDATAEAINQTPLTAEAQVRSQSSACNINGGHSAVGTGFCRYFVLHLVNALPPALHIHRHLILLNQKGKPAKHRKLHTMQRPFARR
jgi:hypothetical protein